jgi:hypothetical protein
MKVEKAEKKLRETKFFLDKMRDQECRAFGDKEPYDFYLSAFLNAGTSFRGEFHVRQDRNRNNAITAWRKAWEDGLSRDDNALYQFMGKDRNAEVHHEGSARSVKMEEIPVGNIYSDASGTVAAASGTLMAAGLGDVSGTAIRKPVYYFTIKGRERKATDACAKYLTLLDWMLAKYKDVQP